TAAGRATGRRASDDGQTSDIDSARVVANAPWRLENERAVCVGPIAVVGALCDRRDRNDALVEREAELRTTCDLIARDRQVEREGVPHVHLFCRRREAHLDWTGDSLRLYSHGGQKWRCYRGLGWIDVELRASNMRRRTNAWRTAAVRVIRQQAR